MWILFYLIAGLIALLAALLIDPPTEKQMATPHKREVLFCNLLFAWVLWPVVIPMLLIIYFFKRRYPNVED